MFNFKKIRKNVKAISPVISVLLMIAVAVVASLVAYAWVMGYMNFQTAKTGQAIQIQSMANSTAVDSAGQLFVYVQNVGDGGVTITPDSVFVNGAMLTTTDIPETGLYIPAQGTETIDTGYSLVVPGTDSATVTVKVTTEGGTFSEVTKTFP